MNPRRAMALKELLAEARVSPVDLAGNPEVVVTGIAVDSRVIGRNEMFVALPGTRTDSHMMVRDAVAAGASALLVEREVEQFPGVATVRVMSTRAALGPLAHAIHRHPARAMIVCGITGTNGKTTTSHLAAHILETAGYRPGVVGTLGAKFADQFIPLENTTPGPIELADIFRRMDDARIDCVAMECSSHAIDQARIGGISFRCGVMLGITQDHLDYHGTFEKYVQAKVRLFEEYVASTPGSVSCFNYDDPVGEKLCGEWSGHLVGFSREADSPVAVRAEEPVFSPRGTAFTLVIDGRRAKVESPLPGDFNLTNMLAASAAAHSLGVSIETIAGALEKAPPVAGRFEFIPGEHPFSVIVDYAHTSDALMRALRTARRLCANRLIVVFGCGGDRDRGKRPLMGRVAGDYADYAIITSDNPRSEEPAAIARQVLEGVLGSHLKTGQHQVVHDRRVAIDRAIRMAGLGDVVMIAGKGHEDYQEIAGRRVHFDDREEARRVLAEISGDYAAREQNDIPMEHHA